MKGEGEICRDCNIVIQKRPPTIDENHANNDIELGQEALSANSPQDETVSSPKPNKPKGILEVDTQNRYP